MNSDLALELVRRANSDLEHFFSSFAGRPVVGTSEEVEALMRVERALRSVGALLNGELEQSANRKMQQELGTYRTNLIRLRRELALMQDSAVASRSQLVERQRHLHAARAWCDASRTTQ